MGGLPLDLPDDFEEKIRNFLKAFPKTLVEVDKLLTRNRIWIERTKGVAYINAEDAIALGLTGPAVRGSGVPYDVRKATPSWATRTTTSTSPSQRKATHIRATSAGSKR